MRSLRIEPVCEVGRDQRRVDNLAARVRAIPPIGRELSGSRLGQCPRPGEVCRSTIS